MMFYYITLILQAICIIHVLKTSKPYWWILVVFFLPLIGSIAYIFIHIYNRNQVSEIQDNVIKSINPTGTINKLKNNVEINDCFENKVLLADAYLQQENFIEAQTIYEDCLSGPFTKDPKVLRQLVHVYYLQGKHQKVKQIVTDKLLKHPDFDRSLAHLRYALSLEQLGLKDEAEEQLETMNDRYSNFQMRYEYALFLLRTEKLEKALDVLEAIELESSRLRSSEKRGQTKWINLSNAELVKIRENLTK